MKLPHLAGFAFLIAAGSASAQRINDFKLEDIGQLPDLKKQVSMQAQVPVGVDFTIEDSTDLHEWKKVSPIIRSTGTFDWSMEYTPPPQGGAAAQDGSTSWSTRRFYRIAQLPPADPPPLTTGAAVAPVASLKRLSTGPFELITPGGWTIRLFGTTLTITNPSGRDTYEMWGSGSGGTGHENLNGKHIKDNFGDSRTLLLPDNTIVTVLLSTTPGTNTISRFSIYTDLESHRLTSYPDGNGSPNTVIMSTSLLRAGEAEEPDGETARLVDTPSGLLFENIYIRHTTDDTPFIQMAQPLGKTGGPAFPNRIDDYYDDPRISYT